MEEEKQIGIKVVLNNPNGIHPDLIKIAFADLISASIKSGALRVSKPENEPDNPEPTGESLESGQTEQ